MPAIVVDIHTSKSIVGGDPNVFQGTAKSFKIRVTNVPYLDAASQTHSADGTFVQELLPGGFTAVDWTATYFAGAAGPASGVGNLNTSITTFPAGGYVEYIVNTTVGAEAGLGLSKNTVLASVPAGLCLVNAQNAIGVVSVNILKKRASVAVNKISTGPFEKGKSVAFIVEVVNNGPVDVDNGSLHDCMPNGIILKNWVATYANGASGPGSGSFLPATIQKLPVGGKATFTLNTWIEPDACVGATVNEAKFVFPGNVDNIDGSTCQVGKLDFQIIEPVNTACVNVCNCISGWACDDTSVPTGYAIIRLVTPNGVTAWDSGRNRSLDGGAYKVDIDATGCWKSPALPVNSQLITARTGEAIPSYYIVHEYVSSTNTTVVGGSGRLVGTYQFRLSSDNVYNGCVNVRELDELNPVARVCVASTGGC